MRERLSLLWRRIKKLWGRPPPSGGDYLRLVGYLKELTRAYKEMMEFLLDKVEGRQDYWRGHTEGLKMRAPSQETLRELELAMARLDELSRFLGWLKTASNKLNEDTLRIGKKLEEEIKRFSPF